MRTFAIWGPLGCSLGALIAGLIGDAADPRGGGALMGMIGGMCAFACLRLWLGSSNKSKA